MVVTLRGSAMQKIIDPHLHFFDLNKGNYDWLKLNNPPFWPDKALILKNCTPSNLMFDSNELDLIGGVHIEAGFDNDKSQNELSWLEQEVYPFEAKLVFKSISYIDIKKPHLDFYKQVSIMLEFPTFAGIRYTMEENEPLYGDFVLVVENLKFLERAGILFEVQLSFCDTLQANYLLRLVGEVPKLKLVINHSGLPPIESSQAENYSLGLSNENSKAFIDARNTWEKNLILFAKLPNCFIKCSGFEMQSRHYTKQDMIEIMLRVHTQFGINRMMLASNFPLTLFTMSYSQYWNLMYECAMEASLDCDLLMHKNARDLYQF